MNRASPMPASRAATRLISSNNSFANRCCDWHWGDAGGRGDRSQPCQGERYPGHRLISSKSACNCGQSLTLERKLHDAKQHLVAAIVELAEVAAIVELAEVAEVGDRAGVALGRVRMAMSVLENE